MLSPDWPATPWVLAVAVLGMLVHLALRARRRDRREYRRFQRYRSTLRRQETLRKWLRESMVTFGGLAVGLLVLAWQFLEPTLTVARALPPGSWLADHGAWSWLVVIVLFVATTLLLVIARREAADGEIPSIGDIQAMIPRNRAEVRIGAALSVNAGVVEELVFRLALPAALFGATGSILVALVGSALAFGALHAYQGIGGVIGTTVIGLFLLALYVASGTILLPILAHALIDLRTFVLIPLIVLRVPAATTPVRVR